jgi:hypothetical protein
VALTQSHYRFGVAELAQNTHGWLAAEDKPVMLPPGRAFLCRACVQANGTGENNVVMQWRYRLTPKATGIPGNWIDITTTSAVVRTGSTTVFTNGQNCTKRLSGTGTFESSAAGCTHDGSAGGASNDIVANGNSETEIGLQLINTDVTVGDVVELRVERAAGVAMNAYTFTPSILVGANVLAIQSRDTSLHTSLPASVAKINGTQVQVEGVGLSASDLADTTLGIIMNVWGTTVPGSTDPADYTTHLYGPDAWQGSANPGKDGMPIKPGFTFAQNIPEGVVRVLTTFQPNKTVTLGEDASIVEAA